MDLVTFKWESQNMCLIDGEPIFKPYFLLFNDINISHRNIGEFTEFIKMYAENTGGIQSPSWELLSVRFKNHDGYCDVCREEREKVIVLYNQVGGDYRRGICPSCCDSLVCGIEKHIDSILFNSKYIFAKEILDEIGNSITHLNSDKGSLLIQVGSNRSNQCLNFLGENFNKFISDIRDYKYGSSETHRQCYLCSNEISTDETVISFLSGSGETYLEYQCHERCASQVLDELEEFKENHSVLLSSKII